MGSDAIAYKATSMYVGRYVGIPLVWEWVRIPGDIGISGPESLVVVGTQHFFIGPDDIYLFDGTVPRSIGTPIREWFFNDLNQTFRDQVVGVADIGRDVVYWRYPSTNSATGALDSVISYNFRTDRWGKQRQACNVPILYSTGQVTYDGLGSLYATYNDLPSIAYDSPFWLTDSTVPAVFIDSVLYQLTGEPGASYFVTGDWGDITSYSLLNRITPRYVSNPTSAVATNFYKYDIGDALVQDSQIGLSSRGRFDFRRAARFHRLRVDQVGGCTINGLDVNIKASSPE